MPTPRTPKNPSLQQSAALIKQAPANTDSGATENYLTLKDIRWLSNIAAMLPEDAITVHVADGNSIRSTHSGTLHVPGVGDMRAYIFPGLQGSLISISALVNMGLSALFLQHTFQSSEIILKFYVVTAIN